MGGGCIFRGLGLSVAMSDIAQMAFKSSSGNSVKQLHTSWRSLSPFAIFATLRLTQRSLHFGIPHPSSQLGVEIRGWGLGGSMLCSGLSVWGLVDFGNGGFCTVFKL